MAFKMGKDAEVWLEGADLSSYFNDLSFSADVDTAETTTFKKDWKTHIPGLVQSKIDLKGLYDPSMTDVSSILAAAQAGDILTTGPAGLEAVGDLARLGLVLTTQYAESSPIGGAVLFNWSVLTDGVLGIGHVLHPLAARASDANGTTFDGLAASSTGAIAHLHVTSVSASDTIDVTIEDSATGSSGWATIGTFAQKSAAGSERIVIAGTVRRYLRAVWDVEGTDPSITFGVAIART